VVPPVAVYQSAVHDGGRVFTSGELPVGRFGLFLVYGLAGHLPRLVEWLEITSPQGVRNHLAAIGSALIERYR